MGDLDDFDADPVPADENDPDYQEEMFRTFRHMGWRPEELRDKAYARKYAEWLEENPADED